MENTLTTKWNLARKIWFGFYIFCQWLMFIEYATKPITAIDPAYQQATLIYGVVGAIGTALILWVAISHKRTALYTMMGVAAANAILTLFQGNPIGALTSMIMPTVNYLIARKGVE